MGSVTGLFLKNTSLVFNLSEYGLLIVLYTNFCRINYAVLENKKSHPSIVFLHFLVCVQTDSKTPAQTNRQIYLEWWDFIKVCASVTALWDLQHTLVIKCKTGTSVFMLVLLKLAFICFPKFISLYSLGHF